LMRISFLAVMIVSAKEVCEIKSKLTPNNILFMGSPVKLLCKMPLTAPSKRC
jgi:hypothetical protein